MTINLNPFVDTMIEKDEKHKAAIDELANAAIDFIDQMRVQGCDIHMIPAEYDTLVDVVKKYRKEIKEPKL